MEIIVILIVQTIEHGDIFEQLCLISLQRGGDVFNVDGYLVIARLHADDLVLRLAEELGKPFGLLRILFKTFQFGNQIHEHIADFTGFLRFDGVQCGLGEIGDFLLRVGTEKEDMVGIGDIHLVDEFIDCFLFGFCQLAFVQPGSLFLDCGSSCLLNDISAATQRVTMTSLGNIWGQAGTLQSEGKTPAEAQAW